jgi:hypothetical protein
VEIDTRSEEQVRNSGNYLAEYNTLRAEILARINIRNSIVFGTLSFAGVLMGFGLETPALAFIYVIISMFLAAAWVQSDVMVSQIGSYIRHHIEPLLDGLEWETHRQEIRSGEIAYGGVRPSVVFSTSGIFLLTQTVALIIALVKVDTFVLLDWLLGGIAVFCELFTIFLFNIAAKQDLEED